MKPKIKIDHLTKYHQFGQSEQPYFVGALHTSKRHVFEFVDDTNEYYGKIEFVCAR